MSEKRKSELIALEIQRIVKLPWHQADAGN